MRKAGPYSAPGSLVQLDKRSREARVLKGVRAELTAHCGGNPSPTVRAMIERAAWLTLRVGQLDARIATDSMNDHDSRTYLAWSNSLARVLRQLGTASVAQRPLSLAETLARKPLPSRGVAA